MLLHRSFSFKLVIFVNMIFILSACAKNSSESQNDINAMSPYSDDSVETLDDILEANPDAVSHIESTFNNLNEGFAQNKEYDSLSLSGSDNKQRKCLKVISANALMGAGIGQNALASCTTGGVGLVLVSEGEGASLNPVTVICGVASGLQVGTVVGGAAGALAGTAVCGANVVIPAVIKISNVFFHKKPAKAVTTTQTAGASDDECKPGGQDQSGKMTGANGAQFTSKTFKENGPFRIDGENPAPGKRAGQCHVQSEDLKQLAYSVAGKDKASKLYYDINSEKFLCLDHPKVKKSKKFMQWLKSPEALSGLIQCLKNLGEKVPDALTSAARSAR